MSLALTYKVPEEVLKPVLNTIYAIFLGFLFNSLFKLDLGGHCRNVTLDFLVTKENCLPLGLLFAYFLFDWLTFNITVEGGVNHLLLILIIVLIVYLGALVILAFVPSMTLYLLFSLYLIGVSWWDFFLLKSVAFKVSKLAASFVVTIIFGMRLSIALYILCSLVFQTWLDVAFQDSSFVAAISFVVAIKFIRYIAWVGLTK